VPGDCPVAHAILSIDSSLKTLTEEYSEVTADLGALIAMNLPGVAKVTFPLPSQDEERIFDALGFPFLPTTKTGTYDFFVSLVMRAHSLVIQSTSSVSKSCG
jgi:hypothetical protein